MLHCRKLLTLSLNLGYETGRENCPAIIKKNAKLPIMFFYELTWELFGLRYYKITCFNYVQIADPWKHFRAKVSYSLHGFMFILIFLFHVVELVHSEQQKIGFRYLKFYTE